MDKPHHGGDLLTAAREFGRPSEQWLDLSTGISPWAYPIPGLPEYIWQRLPYDTNPLILAAARYYQCPENCVTPVAGTQDALWRLPFGLSAGRVAIPNVGYSEHRLAWQAAGHRVFQYHDAAGLLQLVENKAVDHVVVINPNNPTTETFHQDWLLLLRKKMKESGLLVVDEAFMDLDHTHSLSRSLPLTGVLILRSVGKFFGLAGLRLGFILGMTAQVNRLRDQLGPWPVSYPALFVAEKALLDGVWQQQQAHRIHHQSQLLHQALQEHLNTAFSSLGLFVSTLDDRHRLWDIYQSAAQAGILLRYQALDDERAWLRFGLPGDSWTRFEQWLLG